MSTFFKNHNNFTRYAWFVLAFLILVVLWGAFVRATGSGAGCGSHWPLCNGVVVPREPQIETLIELTHRLTSAFSGILVLGMLFWAFRLFPKGHIVRKAAVYSTVFIITEGLVGAGLVLFEWVADNESVARAISMAVHLVNTFLLLAAVTLTAWWAGAGSDFRLQLRGHGRAGRLIGIAVFLLLILGVSGAITALGDTLFPKGELREASPPISRRRPIFSSGCASIILLLPPSPVFICGWPHRSSPWSGRALGRCSFPMPSASSLSSSLWPASSIFC